MEVLITGGAGFIGSNVAKMLEEKGVTVYILDDFSAGNFKNIVDLNCEVICADVLDREIYKKLPQVDAVIHEAAITDTTLDDPRKMMMVNFTGFINILNFCLKRKIKLVYASSAGTYGNGKIPMEEEQPLNPLNYYAYSKYLCDRKVMQIKGSKDLPPIIGLRYFNVYGEGEAHKGKASSMIYQLYLQMKRDLPPRLFKYGEQKRVFIYIRDVALATTKALEVDETTILNVGTGQPRSFNEVVSIINSTLGKQLSPDYFDNPYEEVYQSFTQADVRRAEKILKFTAHYSLEEGIKTYLNLLQKSKEKEDVSGD